MLCLLISASRAVRLDIADVRRCALVDLSSEELLAALEGIARLKRKFPVMNPHGIADRVARYVRGELQIVPCVGGYKYFYLDWNLDIWRCEAWSTSLGSVSGFLTSESPAMPA